jgi:exoribonuclease-2
VHVADPAASITFDSPIEKESRDRGSTLYIPEGSFRMMTETALPIFALGLSEKSPALTFKMTLDSGGEIIDTDIFPSTVKVRRLSYEDADKLTETADTPDAKALCALQDLAERNLKRRTAAGAVNIELPEVHIVIEEGKPKIEPVVPYRSVSLVRECMLIAGEGSGNWAAGNGLAFPYISQEVEIQGDVPSGMAGSFQLRRCMRPRTLSTKPGRHWGLGLETYTQVTSPLRRYTDLLAHLQIRAFLTGSKPLSADEVSARLAAGEAAALEASHAERASRNHWTMAFLSDKKDSVWDAVALEKKGNRWAVIIPALALETQVPLQKDASPNENIKLTLKSVNIPRGEAVFVSTN